MNLTERILNRLKEQKPAQLKPEAPIGPGFKTGKSTLRKKETYPGGPPTWERGGKVHVAGGRMGGRPAPSDRPGMKKVIRGEQKPEGPETLKLLRTPSKGMLGGLGAKPRPKGDTKSDSYHIQKVLGKMQKERAAAKAGSVEASRQKARNIQVGSDEFFLGHGKGTAGEKKGDKK